MFNWVQLVRNENMKIYLRSRAWVMIAVFPVVLLGFALLLKFVVKSEDGGVFEFMSLGGYLSTLVFIFAVVIAGDIVASEFTWGTIKLLLIRPVSRSKILLAKYAAVLLFMLGLLAVLLLSSYLIGLLFFGGGDPQTRGTELGRILADYGFKAVDMLMAVTLSFMISSAFRSSTFAIALSLLLMMVGDPFVSVMRSLGYSWVKYVLFANTNLEPYFFGNKPLFPGMTLGFSVGVLALYGIVFYAVAWLLFTRRDVAG